MSEVKRSALARKLRSRISEPIAIISTAVRAPGARTPEQLWNIVRDGSDMVGEIPMDRWDSSSFFNPNPGTPGKMITRWAGIVADVDRFDAAFFGISSPEALQLDPQQRLALEVAWEAIERADMSPSELAGSATGVFLGIMNGDYFLSTYTGPKSLDMYAATGTSHNIAAGRLSYFFDLRGPCESIDTACSSSLVAIHRASQSLRSGECDLALAGGVNVIVDPWLNVCLSAMGAISPSGRCRAFDAEADGMVRGDGCGLVLLKRLSDAERDDDRVLAVITGSAVNHNGRGQGLTAPNGLAHRALIQQALNTAGTQAADIDYVEAHGTGTRLGDPIELSALADAMGGGERPGRAVVGSAKTNFGHTESASGVISVIKVVQALEHGEMPPQLHLVNVNPHIPLEEQPLVISAERRPWVKPSDAVARAGVSAFGLSGTNAHLVLEGPPKVVVESGQEPASCALLLAGRSEAVLRDLARRLASYLAEHPTVLLRDVCTAANARGRGFATRVALFAGSSAAMRDELLRFAKGEGARPTTQREHDDAPRVVFVCPDVTSIEPEALRALASPAANEALDACAATFAAQHVSLNASADNVQVARARAFTVAVALAAVAREAGIEPRAIIGAGAGPGTAAANYLGGHADLASAARDALRSPSTPNAAASAADIRDKALLVLGDAASVKTVDETIAMTDGKNASTAWVRAAAALQLRGIAIDWRPVLRGSRRAVPPLPTYPFERQRYWATISPTRSMGVVEDSAITSESLGARARRMGTAERQQLLTEYLRKELAETLGSDVAAQLSTTQTLMDVGLTSVLAMSVRNRLQADLELKLPLTLVFEHPTLAALVSHLDLALKVA